MIKNSEIPKQSSIKDSIYNIGSNLMNAITGYFIVPTEINQSNSPDIQTNSIDREELIRNTLKYIDVLIEDSQKSNAINQTVISTEESEKIFEEQKLQATIREKDLALENKMVKLGFYIEEDGKKLGDYGSFMMQMEQNIRDLGIETQSQDYIGIDEYESIKNQLQDIGKEAHQQDNKNEKTKWQDKIQNSNSIDNDQIKMQR